MRFEPKSENDIRAEGLLPEGEYDFEVQTAEDAVSRASNDMLAIKLSVFDADGRTHTVRDWIVSNQHRKLRGFCESIDMLEEYDAGTIDAADLPGKAGRVKVVVRPAGEFPASNGVAYYIRPGEAAVATKSRYGAKPSRSPAPDMDDSIPFAPEWR